MKLAVVILNWNAAEDTARCLRSVEAWGTPGDLPRPTVWIVDNASDEPGIRGLREDHPEARYIVNAANLGFAGGCNRGIQAARADGSDAILLLNNDAHLRDADAGSMLDTLLSSPEIGVVGPALWDGDRLLSAGGRDIALHTATHIRRSDPGPGPVDVDHVSGTAVLIGVRVFDEVGLLDEDYFFGGEVADLCRRARLRGLRSVTDPRARAEHDLSRSSTVRETLHLYYVVRNRFLYARKHHPNRKARLFCLWGLRGARSIAGALVRGDWARARCVGLGVLDGIRGRFGNQNERLLG